jgi:hypothetical protein
MTAELRKDLESGDPYALVGIGFPTSSPNDADEQFARCMVEEFALAGFSAVEVARLFESPVYAASHAVLLRMGPDFVRSVISDVFGGGK